MIYRRLFTGLSATSLLLCLALLILWVRTQRIDEQIEYSGQTTQWSLEASRGTLSFCGFWIANPTLPYPNSSYRPSGTRHSRNSWLNGRVDPLAGRPANGPDLHLGKFRLLLHDNSAAPFPTTLRLVTVPTWLAVLAAMLLPAAWAVIRLRARRRADASGPGGQTATVVLPVMPFADPPVLAPAAPRAGSSELRAAGPALQYAGGSGLLRQWWSRRAGAALFFAAIALPSPVIIKEAFAFMDLRDHETESALRTITFFGCCLASIVLSVAARRRFDGVAGQLPRGRWLAEVAFVLAVIDVTVAGLIAFMFHR